MDLAAALSDTLGKGLALGTPTDVALQVALLLAAVLASFAVRGRWNLAIETRIAQETTNENRIIALRGSKRISFALTLTTLILLASGVFVALGQPTGLFQLAIPLTLVLAAVRILVFLLRIAAGPGGGTSGTELFVSITLWAGCAFYLLGWLPDVAAVLDGIDINIGEIRISLLGVIKFSVLSALLVLSAMALVRVAEGRLSAEQTLDSGVRVGLIKVIRYSLIGFALIVALSAAGFELTSLAVVGGALGVGIGFGLQKVTSNLISGFLLLFDRSIRPGDVITIGESYGWVAKMGARYLVVRDLGGVDTLIPNEELITSQVKNWSYGDRHVRIKLPVQISYSDDPEMAMELMLTASKASDRVIADPAPTVRLMGFGDNGIDLELSVWIDDPEEGIHNVRSDINLAIWRAFKERRITIPFPQRDLHVKQVDPLAPSPGDDP
ncbi:MAG: mechanosensitive ion channel [Pseudomonadota bacterium]|nr:mechanosensitive ion channel [Pseudomonadota bacterium]